MPEVIILCLAFVSIAALAMVNYVERIEFHVWLENRRRSTIKKYEAHNSFVRDSKGNIFRCNTFNGTPNHAVHAAPMRS